MNGSAMIRTGPIRYATAERFARPRPVAAEDAPGSSGQICPQLASRLDAVMGPPLDGHPQGEDCLNLSVTTPARDSAARPVLVWFHGGGFSSGGGIMDWYDGGALAAQGDVVVVGVNHRLGALGYLCLEGVSEGNLGLLDQLEALRWVRANIADYGGDPTDVTVFGQSAGGLSIRLLMEMAQARGLFRRAILQSAPLAITARPRADALALGRIFADFLTTDPRTATVTELLAAQRRTAVANQRRSGSTLEPPFNPVEGTDPVPALDGASFDGNVRGLDVLYGWNADDMTAFPGEGDDAAELTRRMYEEPLRKLGTRLAGAGARVHTYRLDWRPAGSPFGATHCVELPLLLGTRDAWRASPMLGDVPWEDVERTGAALRAAWIAFARTGAPCPGSGPVSFGRHPGA
ncbi:carboxylesterase family protein [Streptomyces sp. AM 4-1-1]|uniref:carboxylesterase family protein n=1 Tax=Streptomyces sp. AM 4-1-1 TaxID=3028710 RepID=UPI0023B97606|nr:carboxylesterase family protein [Streptomyces sp. AM 4-1-1]WEH37102.1 carboxylesterase family protein [Streptomyces sp. AM 4-1-1]